MQQNKLRQASYRKTTRNKWRQKKIGQTKQKLGKHRRASAEETTGNNPGPMDSTSQPAGFCQKLNERLKAWMTLTARYTRYRASDLNKILRKSLMIPKLRFRIPPTYMSVNQHRVKRPEPRSLAPPILMLWVLYIRASETNGEI